MKVDFNNMRLQLIKSHNRLVKTLNNSIEENGEMILDTADIQSEMEFISSRISTLGCVYSDEIDDISDQFTIEHFNPNEL